MNTCSGGAYSSSADLKPSFREAVRWVLQKKYISSAAVAMASFEQVNEHLRLLNMS
jgi:predicted aldo/keto reductase-like oxidoreductase